METVAFKTLKTGDTFFIETDEYNRIAQCYKLTESTAQEIFGDELVFKSDDLVMIEN